MQLVKLHSHTPARERHFTSYIRILLRTNATLQATFAYSCARTPLRNLRFLSVRCTHITFLPIINLQAAHDCLQKLHSRLYVHYTIHWQKKLATIIQANAQKKEEFLCILYNHSSFYYRFFSQFHKRMQSPNLPLLLLLPQASA